MHISDDLASFNEIDFHVFIAMAAAAVCIFNVAIQAKVSVISLWRVHHADDVDLLLAIICLHLLDYDIACAADNPIKLEILWITCHA